MYKIGTIMPQRIKKNTMPILILTISTKIVANIERYITSLARKMHFFGGTFSDLIKTEIPVKIDIIPANAQSTPLAIIRNFGVSKSLEVDVIIRIHIRTKTTPEIANNILVKTKKLDHLFFIK